MTETEPEFDINERDEWYALQEWDDAHCKVCGQLRAICEDPNTDWYPQRHICWGNAAQRVASRQWEAKHEKAKPDEAGYLPTDGVTIWVSPEDLTPDDDFL